MKTNVSENDFAKEEFSKKGENVKFTRFENNRIF
jgi:hypothetical protein